MSLVLTSAQAPNKTGGGFCISNLPEKIPSLTDGNDLPLKDNAKLRLLVQTAIYYLMNGGFSEMNPFYSPYESFWGIFALAMRHMRSVNIAGRFRGYYRR